MMSIKRILDFLKLNKAVSNQLKSTRDIVIPYEFEDIAKRRFNIENLGDYVIQGVTSAKTYVLITAYTDTGENSKIFVFDENYNLLKETFIYNNAHVGGITYDKDHDFIWITDKQGKISAYKLDDIINNSTVEPVYKKVDVSLNLINIFGNLGAAFVTYYKNRIYVGNYNIESKSIIKSYEVCSDGNINLASERIIKSTNAVQGISFIENNGETYMAISSSFGKDIFSVLRIIKFDEYTEDIHNVNAFRDIMPHMLEQISFKENGLLLTVYEANAKKYKTKFSRTNYDLVEIDLSIVFHDLNEAKKEIDG